MALLYADFEPAIQAPFQRGTYGTAWGAAFGNVKDLHLQRMKQGVLSRFPTFAPPDAIGQIALERQMVQGVNETLAHFVQRLLNPWGVWTEGGTYWGLLAELAAAGYDGGSNGSVYIAASNGYVYGPGDTVTVPDPVNGLPGNPPGFVRLPPWYSFGAASAALQWAADTDYAVNAVVTPIGSPGSYFVCTQGGTTGGIEPAWPGPAGSVTDGTVTWTYQGNYHKSPVYPPWNFGGADGQGSQAIPTVAVSGVNEAIGPGGEPSPDGAFWSRFVVIFDPMPSSWSSISNPPTPSSAPKLAEISVIQEIIAKLKPAKSTCVGIVGLGTGTRACWGWPLTTTPNIPDSNWMSRAISAGDVDEEYDFDAQAPQTIESWLANTTFRSGLAFVYMIPSSAWENGNTPTLMLFEATGPAITTGFFEPAWPTTIGDTVVDNGVTWTAIATLYRWQDQTGVTVFTF